MTTWSEQYVDQQVDRAWMGLRMDLAERFEAGLTSCEMIPIDITAPTGETLSVNLVEDHVVVMAGDSVVVTQNVDEAAYEVFAILHEQWHVLHPVFLDSTIVEVPQIDDNPTEVIVPAVGRAETKEQLHSWVVATFNEGRTTPVRVAANGDVHWRTRKGARVTVRVHNAGRIELISALGHEVGFKRARKVIDRLSRQYFGLKFFFVRDTLVMSQILVAYPFSGEALDHALKYFLKNTDDLGWVADAVLRKRVKQQRALAVPPALMALLPSANRVASGVLAENLAAAAGSQATLAAWREICHREWQKARRLPRDAEDPQRVNHRLRMGWWRLRRAVDAALETPATPETPGQVGEVA